MSDWHESEAKAECLDLRVRVKELEAEAEAARQSARGWKALHRSKKGRVAELEQSREKTYKAGYIDGWHERDNNAFGNTLDEIDSYWGYFSKEPLQGEDDES